MKTFPDFKRTETEFVGGDAIGGTYLGKQPVQIIRKAASRPGEDPDEFDEWRIRTYAGKEHVVDGCDLHPHPESPATNVERIEHFMTWARTGVVAQAFVFEAMRIYGEQVQAMPDDQRARMDSGMMPYATWRAAADEALDFLASNT